MGPRGHTAVSETGWILKTDALRGCNLSYATPLPMGGVWKNATWEGARRGTLEQDTLRCVSSTNDSQASTKYSIGAGAPLALAKSSSHTQVWDGVGTVGKSDETGRMSGLLVAVLDRDSYTLAIGA